MPFWKNMAEVMDEVLDNVHSVTNLAKYVHFYWFHSLISSCCCYFGFHRTKTNVVWCFMWYSDIYMK